MDNLSVISASPGNLPPAASVVLEEDERGARFGRLYGGSEPMRKVYRLISKVAPTEATVLLVGESGCGKELVATTIHELSARRSGPPPRVSQDVTESFNERHSYHASD